jgi:sucrose-6-phosphate hydrolase SacC (GH32 family)
MKWSKLGKIFDPTDHALAHNCREFAQSPQALVLSDRVRIYFSTRERDSVGKYLSHVAFVDFDRRLQTILGVSNHTVIPLGELGCFDEHGIFPISPVKDGDRVLAYTTGWTRRVSVSVDAAIGLAISTDDGWTFQKVGSGPVLSASLKEPFLVADGYVTHERGLYHMWYIYGTRWKQSSPSEPPDRVYKIAYAQSDDGENWRRDGRQIIADRLNADECQALPTVFHRDGAYHMYFCYRQAHGFRTDSQSGYRVGYARSTDMTNWERDDAAAGITVSDDGWDSQMQCYPNVFQSDGRFYMLYNGNEFGRFGFGLAVLED